MRIFIADSIYSIFTNKSILLISFSLTYIISTLKYFLQIEFLGFSLGILGFLTILIIFDFITGMKASIYNKQKITSRKGLRSVDKLISYFMFICFTALLQSLLMSEGYLIGVSLISNFKILIFSAIFLWEFHSIGENLEKRYGTKPRIFTIIDIVTKALEKKIITQITGEEITKEIEDENSDDLNENI